jgi:hypothetical protein
MPARTDDITHPGLKNPAPGTPANAPRPGHQPASSNKGKTTTTTTTTTRRTLNKVLNNAGEQRLDWLMATRAVWALVVLLWVSTKFDATLVVALVSACVTTLSLPLQDRIEEYALKWVPGVANRLNVHHLVEPLVPALGKVLAQGWSAHAAAGALGGAALVIVALLLGRFLSKRSPFAALLVYIVALVTNTQSGFLDDYPVRLAVPLMMLLLSGASRHVRYLNLAAVVATVLSLAAAEADTRAPAVAELVPQALWAGLALLVVHDLLVRSGVVDLVRVAFESCVLLFTLLVVLHLAAAELYGAGALRAWADDRLPRPVAAAALALLPEPGKPALEWPAIAIAECLPKCAPAFEAALPGVFATSFCAVVLLRGALGAPEPLGALLASVLAAGVVVSVCAGALLALGRERMLLRADVTAVVSALCVLFVENVVARSPRYHAGAGRRVAYHVIKYWITAADRRAAAAAREIAAHTKGGPNEPVSPAEARKQEQAQALAEEAAAGPSEDALKRLWDLVAHDRSLLDKTRVLHKRYRAAAFQQEASVSAYKSEDDASVTKAQEARAKAEQLTNKCRELSTEMKKIEERLGAAEDKARAMEHALHAKRKELQQAQLAETKKTK